MGYLVNLENVYKNKKVLVTGHTGFKGSWLSTWLLSIGADVYGYSDNIPTSPSLFETLNLENKIHHNIGDIRDLNNFSSVINDIKPDFIFHLAAQAIVSQSFNDPLETLSSNIMGTSNLLAILKDVDFNVNVVVITSDKCYENVETYYGYRESDALGGKDIYSSSKACAELIFSSFYRSYFINKPNVNIASARAGNVIGGGDWANDRIIADVYRSWSKSIPIEMRSPNATRPWQHVLEPLSGYLLLGTFINNKLYNGESYNFGPSTDKNITVNQLVTDLAGSWDDNLDNKIIIHEDKKFPECNLLKLCCDKALFELNWNPVLDYKNTVKFVSSWYESFYLKETDMYTLTVQQIKEYINGQK